MLLFLGGSDAIERVDLNLAGQALDDALEEHARQQSLRVELLRKVSYSQAKHKAS